MKILINDYKKLKKKKKWTRPNGSNLIDCHHSYAAKKTTTMMIFNVTIIIIIIIIINTSENPLEKERERERIKIHHVMQPNRNKINYFYVRNEMIKKYD